MVPGVGGNSQHYGAAGHTGSTAAYNPNVPSNLQGGGNAIGISDHGVANGVSGVHSSGGPRSGIHGNSAVGSLGTGTKGSDTGPVGVGNGYAGGTGNGTGYQAVGSHHGVAGGIGADGGPGEIKGQTGISARTDGGGTQTVGGPKAAKTTVDTGDNNAGVTHAASFGQPRTPPIPESLKATVLDASATIHVVFEANGSLRASVKKSSGYLDLDEAARAACSRIKFKPAMENGTAVKDEQDFTIHFSNRG